MYEIKILSNKDFDKVAKSDRRYRFVDENNLGFADRQKGVAYVRQTHVHDLNKYLVSHELEELEKDESVHQDAYGIRHKKFFKDFWLPMMSSVVQGYMSGGAEAGVASGILTGLNALMGNKQPQQIASGSYSTASNAQNKSGSYAPSGSYSPLSSFNLGAGASSGRLPSAFSGNYSPTITKPLSSSFPDNVNFRVGNNVEPGYFGGSPERQYGSYKGAIKF